MYERIVRYCQDHGLTISDFEKLCGLSNGMVGKWKNGTEPSGRSLIKVSKATGIDIAVWLEACYE